MFLIRRNIARKAWLPNVQAVRERAEDLLVSKATLLLEQAELVRARLGDWTWRRLSAPEGGPLKHNNAANARDLGICDPPLPSIKPPIAKRLHTSAPCVPSRDSGVPHGPAAPQGFFRER